jgi:hypothetical protein
MRRKIEPIPVSIAKAYKKTPYVAKPARMLIKIALAVTAVALAVVEAALVAATLAAAFGANPYRKQISI